MICERCGSTIPEGQKFCGQCGAPAPAVVQSHPPSAPTPVPATPEPAPPTSSRFNTRSCLLIGVGCLAVLLIGACLAIAFVLPAGRGWYQNLRSQFNLDNLPNDAVQLILPEQISTMPAELATVTPIAAPDFCAQEFCLSYPEGLGFVAQATTKSAELDPDVWAIPEHLELTFPGYPLVDTRLMPHLGLYDTARFREVNPNVGDLLDRLQDMLDSRPADPENVPLISIFNAAQMITADVKYLDFEGGRGVRFVTQYGQAVWPINNYDLFYAFSGLSDDGSTLIVAIMPIANQALPDNADEIISGDMESFMQGFEAYIASTAVMLNSAAPESFTPNIERLDDLMRSIELTP
jgi:hypothetical protein